MALILLAAMGCGIPAETEPPGTAESAASQASPVRVSELVARRDGSLVLLETTLPPAGQANVVFDYDGSAPRTVQLRGVPPLHRPFEHPEYGATAHNLASHWLEDAHGDLIRAGVDWFDTTDRRVAVLRVVKMPDDGTAPLELFRAYASIFLDGQPHRDVTKPGISSVSADLGPDGTLYVGFYSQVGLAVAGHEGTVPGFYVVRCPSTGDACRPELVLAEQASPQLGPHPGLNGGIGLAADGDGVLAAVHRGDASATLDLYRVSPTSVAHETMSVPAPGAGPFSTVRVASGNGRIAIAATTQADGLSLLERTGAGWAERVRLPLVGSDGETDLVFTAASGFVLSKKLRLESIEGSASTRGTWRSVGRVWRESQQFSGRAYHPDAYNRHTLLPDGRIRGEINGMSPATFDGDRLPFVATTGAGTMAQGREPCLSGLVPRKGRIEPGSFAQIYVPQGQTLMIPAGTCVTANAITGEGEVVFEGTEQRPIHLLSTEISVRKIRAKWTFFEGTAWPEVARRAPEAGDIDMDHVSIMGYRALYGPIQSVDRPSDRLTLRHVDIRSFTGEGEPGAAMLTLRRPTQVTIEDSTFADFGGTALRLDNTGFNQTSLTMRRVTMTNVVQGVELLAATEDARNESLVGLGQPYPTTPISTPVFMQDVRIEGRPTSATTRVAGIYLNRADGLLDRVTVTGVAGDGVFVDMAHLLTLESARLTLNTGHGLAATADVPAGQGPCAPPPPPPGPSTWPPPPSVNRVFCLSCFGDHDPIVRDSLITSNGKAGIWLWGPNVPLEVTGTRIADNAGPALLIENGTGISEAVRDPSCPNAPERPAATVALPIAPPTFLRGNDILRNGGPTGPQIVSRHTLGTLPMDGNYWSPSPTLQSVGTIGTLPISSTPFTH